MHPSSRTRPSIAAASALLVTLAGCVVSGDARQNGEARAGGEPRAESPRRAMPPPLPRPVANNAVAAAATSRGWTLYSFMGIDSTRRWDGITSAAFAWTVGDTAWRPLPPVPGPGRLAATARTVRGRVYVFGGYTVARDGAERSVPDVNVLDPESGVWHDGAPIPIPVDDAVSGLWRDSLVFLISGWHDRGNEAAVQVYDAAADAWRQATPIPGPPVFGHAGGIAGDAIVYLDGTRVDENPRRFSIESSSWLGAIDPADPTRIDWRRLPPHPGPPLYRAAAVGIGSEVVFAGGTDNPYNYDGIGYDGVPSRPLSAVFAWDLAGGRWVDRPPLEIATMDHRGIVVARGDLYLVGGMIAGPRVTDRATRLPSP